MITYIKDKLHCLFLFLAMKTGPEDNVIVPMTIKEYGDFLDYQDSIFIIYENEDELKNDFPNAKLTKEN